jgi:FkbM family methyltransferase
MAQKVGTSGLVLSFEPDWRNFQLFLRNLAQNNARNVVAHSVALGDHPRLAKLALGAQLGHSTLRADAHECAQVVSVLTLDGLASLLPRRGVRLMKMDVEGFEVAVVRGARDVLRETDLVICEVNHTFLEEANSSARELFEIMKSLGFASYCASLESDGQWVAADSTFIPSVSYSTGHTAFDALFCRDPDRLPRALVATW